MEEPGISKECSQEKLERDRKECEEIATRNEKVYRLLLGEKIFIGLLVIVV